MLTQIIFRVWRDSGIFEFFNEYFSKDLSQSSTSGNPIDSFDRSKARKIVRKYKKGH